MIDRRKWIRVGLVLLGILAIGGAFVANMLEIGNHASRLHLELIGTSLYDYRARTGQWPTQASDLAITELPRQCPHDIGLIERGSYLVVWPRDLDLDRAKNAHRILVYENGTGLRDWVSGKRWVCWGDLRVEYIEHSRLEAALQADKD